MACVRKRRGKWVADYRDAFGRRCWITKDTRREAEAALAEKLRTEHGGRRARLHPDTTLAAFVPYWLTLVAARDVDPETVVAYERVLARHVLPALGARKVRDLEAADLLALLAEKLTTKALSRARVKFVLAALRSALHRAVSDGLLGHNPAERLGRELNLGRSR